MIQWPIENQISNSKVIVMTKVFIIELNTCCFVPISAVLLLFQIIFAILVNGILLSACNNHDIKVVLIGGTGNIV